MSPKWRIEIYQPKPDIFDLINPKKLDNLMLRYPKLSHFQVLWYPLPLQKILFFAYLYNLEQEKKGVKMIQFCPDLPPPSMKFHTFFRLRTSLIYLDLLFLLSQNVYFFTLFTLLFLFTFCSIHQVFTFPFAVCIRFSFINIFL